MCHCVCVRGFVLTDKEIEGSSFLGDLLSKVKGKKFRSKNIVSVHSVVLLKSYNSYFNF